jgi:hypothetical protein
MRSSPGLGRLARWHPLEATAKRRPLALADAMIDDRSVRGAMESPSSAPRYVRPSGSRVVPSLCAALIYGSDRRPQTAPVNAPRGREVNAESRGPLSGAAASMAPRRRVQPTEKPSASLITPKHRTLARQRRYAYDDGAFLYAGLDLRGPHAGFEMGK